MCTVTFVSTKNGCILTTNRDETILRGKALPPTEHEGNTKKIVFPKDPKTNGTWAIHDYSNCAILLNGAGDKHIKKEKYRKSRGLILIDIFDSENVLEKWAKISLKDIEPFTIILYYKKKLFQLRWNEIKKSKIELSISKSYIWSSATLYSTDIIKHREEIFQNHLEKSSYTSKEILDFHQFKDEENLKNTILIKRNNHLKTVSITQYNFENHNIFINYIDLYE